MSWWRPERAAPAVDPPAASPTNAAPAAAPAAAPQAWERLAPVQRALTPPDLLAPSAPFTAGLATRGDPRFLRPLGHDRGPDGPAGQVATVARTSVGSVDDGPVLPVVSRSGPSGPTPAAVQRVASLGPAPGPVAATEVLAASSVEAQSMEAPAVPETGSEPDAPSAPPDAPVDVATTPPLAPPDPSAGEPVQRAEAPVEGASADDVAALLPLTGPVAQRTLGDDPAPPAATGDAPRPVANALEPPRVDPATRAVESARLSLPPSSADRPDQPTVSRWFDEPARPTTVPHGPSFAPGEDPAPPIAPPIDTHAPDVDAARETVPTLGVGTSSDQPAPDVLRPALPSSVGDLVAGGSAPHATATAQRAAVSDPAPLVGDRPPGPSGGSWTNVAQRPVAADPASAPTRLVAPGASPTPVAPAALAAVQRAAPPTVPPVPGAWGAPPTTVPTWETASPDLSDAGGDTSPAAAPPAQAPLVQRQLATGPGPRAAEAPLLQRRLATGPGLRAVEAPLLQRRVATGAGPRAPEATSPGAPIRFAELFREPFDPPTPSPAAIGGWPTTHAQAPILSTEPVVARTSVLPLRHDPPEGRAGAQTPGPGGRRIEGEPAAPLLGTIWEPATGFRPVDGAPTQLAPAPEAADTLAAPIVSMSLQRRFARSEPAGGTGTDPSATTTGAPVTTPALLAGPVLNAPPWAGPAATAQRTSTEPPATAVGPIVPSPARPEAFAAGTTDTDRMSDVAPLSSSAVTLQRDSAPAEAAPEPAPSPAAAPAAASPAAPAPAGGTASAGGPDIEELARRLFDPLSARLRAELWLDRERAGLIADLRR